ncbi:hypothetical protein MJO28_007360 [Puccinia striiformis f. sp. tritici]|uniref:Uncharacterized protein n=2 Tax=Puccinia striiformis f. sp. tritici TaxID=168172 RepID=A0A0L0VW14_9BASI|nr:hypothetical protein Pst134EA_013472 [Puccinia striiformis f. sp. tritici]KNF03397.1 hypothetical protein PSTG_03337 [Puccinia striiformis f. sp. tritici PST-78]KAH9454361.1 hypothetical protein Pst134EB_014450 [Puccinia striiformis f. sp. tritici]KAH9465591.1 hypothetical protein Pst134EA_013472 [Puccinia striiformis f. sp. tritici]KAI7932996.1 hypothetical protein MJO29_017076 [Puccinia striiformis f. sp. tritici]KAI7951676.1 hypothetical protein MJO28_007360 [Puccinia striiformis f. sp. 
MFDFITSDTKHRGDLVTLGFENLISKNSRGTSGKQKPRAEPRSKHIRLINSKRDTLQRLYSYILPLVSVQINHLTRLLLGLDSHEEPGSQLKLVLELQQELDYTLDQIRSTGTVALSNSSSQSISRFNSNSDSESDSDDESSSDSEEDEPRSRNIMQITKADLWPMLGDSFRKSCDLVLHLKLSSETPEGQIDIAFTKRDLSRLASRICGDLHETVDSLKESDFDNSDIVIANINRTLRDFVLPTRERYFSILDPSSRQKDPRFRINESAIVVMKLARLFFRQLSRRELIIEKELSLLGSLSEKLKNLHDLPLTAIGQLEALSHILGRFDIPTTSVSHLPPPEIVTQSTRYVESTKGSFRRALIAVDTFVTWLPTNGGSLDQRYFKTWFRDWDTLFTLAANHLLEAIDSFVQ